MNPPTFDDIVAASEFVGQYLPKTPLVAMPKLSQLFGFDYYAKCENLQPVGAFKVRGGVNLVGTASAEEKHAGMVFSQHGQSRPVDSLRRSAVWREGRNLCTR